MALITSCQATFQNFSGYEDDLASLEDHENLGTDQYVRPGGIHFPLRNGDDPEGF